MKRSFAYFRKLALAEGVSYLLLGITMPIKYQLGIKEPNYIIGLAHGILFVVYSLMVLFFLIKGYKSFKWAFLTMLASLLPFGTFVADKYLFREEGN